jgi:hypothetical protein
MLGGVSSSVIFGSRALQTLGPAGQTAARKQIEQGVRGLFTSIERPLPSLGVREISMLAGVSASPSGSFSGKMLAMPLGVRQASWLSRLIDKVWTPNSSQKTQKQQSDELFKETLQKKFGEIQSLILEVDALHRIKDQLATSTLLEAHRIVWDKKEHELLNALDSLKCCGFQHLQGSSFDKWLKAYGGVTLPRASLHYDPESALLGQYQGEFTHFQRSGLPIPPFLLKNPHVLAQNIPPLKERIDTAGIVAMAIQTLGNIKNPAPWQEKIGVELTGVFARMLAAFSQQERDIFCLNQRGSINITLTVNPTDSDVHAIATEFGIKLPYKEDFSKTPPEIPAFSIAKALDYGAIFEQVGIKVKLKKASDTTLPSIEIPNLNFPKEDPAAMNALRILCRTTSASHPAAAVVKAIVDKDKAQYEAEKAEKKAAEERTRKWIASFPSYSSPRGTGIDDGGFFDGPTD